MSLGSATSARDGNPLLLTAGELLRQVARAMLDADAFERLEDAPASLPRHYSSVEQCNSTFMFPSSRWRSTGNELRTLLQRLLPPAAERLVEVHQGLQAGESRLG